MLLNWYSYSITYFWNWLGKVLTISFHLLQKLGEVPNAFYILLISVLFFYWMFKMNSYYKDHKDKGLIQ